MNKAIEIIKVIKNERNKRKLKKEYFNYCKYLQEKYGIPPKPYFYNEENRNKNQGNKHKKYSCVEIHHIQEIEVPGLSKKNAPKHPWTYHLPENLVYANIIEHLLLHSLINLLTSETGLLNRFIAGKLTTAYLRNKWTNEKSAKQAEELINMFGGYENFQKIVEETLIILLKNNYDMKFGELIYFHDKLGGNVKYSELIILKVIPRVREEIEKDIKYKSLIDTYNYFFKDCNWEYNNDISFLDNMDNLLKFKKGWICTTFYETHMVSNLWFKDNYLEFCKGIVLKLKGRKIKTNSFLEEFEIKLNENEKMIVSVYEQYLDIKYFFNNKVAIIKYILGTEKVWEKPLSYLISTTRIEMENLYENTYLLEKVRNNQALFNYNLFKENEEEIINICNECENLYKEFKELNKNKGMKAKDTYKYLSFLIKFQLKTNKLEELKEKYNISITI